MNGTQDPLVIARFWSKVDVRRPKECWPWRAKSVGNGGHGLFRPSKEIPLAKAHRFAWEAINGAIPAGQVVRHHCDNAPCCNPAHLALGTQADNVADMHERKRRRYATRFSNQEIEDIRRRYSAGERQRDLAVAFRCSQAYVSMLISGGRGAAITKGIQNVR